MDTAGAAQVTIPKRAWLALGVTSMAVFMFFLDATVVNIAFPSIHADFSGASRAAVSWVISAYSIAFGAFVIASGRIADLRGRRTTFHAGVVLFVVASAACGLAPNVESLVAGRFIQAIGGALVVPAALALVLPEFPPQRRVTAVGAWSGVAALAAAIGPSAGSALVEWAGWRWIFGVNVPVGVVTLLLSRRILAESRDETARRPDMAGSIFLGTAMAALALGIVQGGEWGWTDGRVFVALGVFAALIPAFVVRSIRHPSPAVDLTLFRSRGFSIAILASFVFSVAFFAAMLNNVLFLTGVWRYSVLGAGLAITPGPLTAAVTSVLGGRLADRYGARRVIVPGIALTALANAWFAIQAGPGSSYLSVWLPGALLLGAGIGFGFSTLGGAAAASVPPSRFAQGSAVLSAARQMGSVVGVAMVVAILSAGASMATFRRSWWILAAISLGSGLISVALPASQSPSPTAGREVPRAAAR